MKAPNHSLLFFLIVLCIHWARLKGASDGFSGGLVWMLIEGSWGSKILRVPFACLKGSDDRLGLHLSRSSQGSCMTPSLMISPLDTDFSVARSPKEGKKRNDQTLKFSLALAQHDLPCSTGGSKKPASRNSVWEHSTQGCDLRAKWSTVENNQE